ncbi:hypothetical protein TVAG_340890 [Trichomonas vaginalis G3]|uniref:Uncharacterized protein n=1 Tax=Trichomonas vaginalis (strain ATCC PRA-98 / G3) TaxID=412133 RepID=A2DTP8_TRIV3|nr:armadillo (ARM) repeat-containing protein family [Trichomonas vaginalis G3]EAY16195.1 hypothetical protein TVAG_340890 [Trichomonas vaginalis G3]KAI5493310.1 armadillo (ARM) repeat-containing protein family [Trichomonas vaginalis G3]|eukprot:XP_001328418.1 hypothetical protein [Trichomonas vaginalis G3]
MKSKSFDNLQAILTHPTCTLITLLQQEDLIPAIQLRASEITNYLSDHIQEFFDIVFDSKDRYPKVVKEKARSCLTSRLSFYSPELLNDVITHLMQYIRQEGNHCEFGIVSFTKILYYLIRNTNSGVLERYDTTVNLIQELFRKVQHPAILDLLIFITNDHRQHTANFIRKVGAAKFLTSFTDTEGPLCEYSLLLLRNIIINPENFTQLQLFEDSRIFERIFQLALSQNPSISRYSFQIINDVINTYMYDDEETRSENKIYNSTWYIILKNIPNIVERITSAPIYQIYLDPALNLLTNISKAGEDVTNKLVMIAKYTFRQLQKYPNHSKVHSVFLTILHSIEKMQDEDIFYNLIRDLKLREAIIDAYRSETFNVNRAFFLEFADIINKKDSKNGRTATPDWNSFINNEYKHTKELIRSPYGGPMPSAEAFEEDEDCYESRENSIDENAKEDAIKIFGHDYLIECEDLEEDEDFEEEDFVFEDDE